MPERRRRRKTATYVMRILTVLLNGLLILWFLAMVAMMILLNVDGPT